MPPIQYIILAKADFKYIAGFIHLRDAIDYMATLEEGKYRLWCDADVLR